MKHLLIILSTISLLTSCRTTKYVDKLVYKTDSTATKERDSLLQVKRQDSVYYKNLIESLSENNVIFRDTGSVKIFYRPDGSIESVEGQVRSLNSKLDKMQSETLFWQRKFDSLSHIKTKDSIQLKTEYKTVEVKKKVSFIPWWVWLIVLAGLAIGWKLNKIKTLFI